MGGGGGSSDGITLLSSSANSLKKLNLSAFEIFISISVLASSRSSKRVMLDGLQSILFASLAYKTFTVEMTETTAMKAGKTETDEISFKSEKLNSKFMTTQNHFPAATYTVSVDSSSGSKDISFQSDGKNPDGEEIKWEGTVIEKDIEGTVVISKKGKTKKEYSFTGTLKEKPEKK